MVKNRTKIIITAVLILVLIFAWANTFRVLSKIYKLNKPSNTPSATIPTPSAISAIPPVSKREWREDDNLEWKRCPFSGTNYSKETSTEELAISGIIWDEANPRTIINGQICGEGEKIGDFLIEKIEKQRVILSNGTKTVELHI
jgi:hypothetical protein